MFCIIPESNDPFFNLALEEILLKNSQEEFLILGINERSVIIGKHQTAHRETDTRFVTENKIPVIRRISGGGTVFHDMGNLNFTFVLNGEKGKQVDFKKYTLPVIEFLSAIGVDARFEGKNDIKVDGLKISGNAEHVFRNRILHHGTLLFNTDLNMLKAVIRNETGNYLTKAVSSNPSEVANLKLILKSNLQDCLSGRNKLPYNAEEFRSIMLEWFLENYPRAEICSLDENYRKMAGDLALSKYRTWEWNYAYGPEYHFNNRIQIAGVNSLWHLYVKEGIIIECEIKGLKQSEIISARMRGRRHMVEDLIDILNEENIFESGFNIYNLF